MNLLFSLFLCLGMLLTSNLATASDFVAGNDDWSQPQKKQKKSHLEERYEVSPLSRVMTKEQFRSIGKYHFKGQSITIDTHNKEACLRIRELLINEAHMSAESLKSLCSSKGGRYVSIVRMSQDEFEFQEAPTLGDQFEKLNLMGLGMMGLIASLPSDISNWEGDFFSHAIAKWKVNATSMPVVDSDHWAINYVGHPISGAAYYVMARQTGLEALPSFGFAAVMSTFFWEYGYEALAEAPSIQDLILTPTLGALIGEQMFKLNEVIRSNNNELFGSKSFGRVGLIVTDPAGAIVSGLSKLGNNRYLFNGEITWGAIPIEIPGARTLGIPAVFLRVDYGRR